MARLSVIGAGLGVLVLSGSSASAQVPPPAQPYPAPAPQPYPQPAPGQPYPQPQPYPAPGQPYPQPQPYPGAQQPYPPPGQPYPAPGQPYPAPYGQPPYGQPGYGQPPPGYPQPAPGPYPQPMPAPAQPAQGQFRSPGEMAYLYGVSVAYGAGAGIWLDALAGVNDPGLAIIAPIALGIAAPVGAYVWDATDELGRGVPSSIATGMLLGGVEGVAVSGLQWQLSGGVNGGSDQWTFPTWSTLTFLGATGGGIGGFVFGEFAHPDPRGLAFISSGAGWGSMFGAMFGAGAASSHNYMGNGAAIGGFISYNAGIAATGFVSLGYTPSWESLKYMWLGDVLGTLAATPVFLFYINSTSDTAQHGFIATALGGLAGLGIAAALTANLQDSPSTTGWVPPFNLAVSPNPGGGVTMSASGMW